MTRSYQILLGRKINMQDPNNTSIHSDAGGNSKIKPTSKDGDSYAGVQDYGFMVNGTLQNPAMGAYAMPEASPISIMTSGDPGHASV